MNNFPYKLAIVNQLTESQLDESVVICIRGYVESPSVDVMTGGNKSLVEPLFRAMVRACQLDGRIYTATVIDTGAIAGLALWFPPGKVLWQKSAANIAGYIISLIVRSDAQRNLGFNQFLESLSLKTREWWINTYGPALADINNDRRRPARANERLSLMGIDSILLQVPARANERLRLRWNNAGAKTIYGSALAMM